ncbi:MAG: hydrogenase maturation protease [Terriglobales bacterium]
MPENGDSDLPEYCRKPTLVLACGNLLFGDDGFGCALVEYVESHHRVPDDVCILDAGTGVRSLLFTLCLSDARPRRILIVDALDAARSPGELFELDPSAIPPIKLDDFSMHQIPTSNLLRELQESCGVEVRVLACQTGELPKEISPGLSPPVQAALPQAAEWVVREYLPDHGHRPIAWPREPENQEPARHAVSQKGDDARRGLGSCDT